MKREDNKKLRKGLLKKIPEEQDIPQELQFKGGHRDIGGTAADEAMLASIFSELDSSDNREIIDIFGETAPSYDSDDGGFETGPSDEPAEEEAPVKPAPKKETVNIFSILDEEDEEEEAEELPPEEPVYTEPEEYAEDRREEYPDDAPDGFAEEVVDRRKLIEHTSKASLTAEEIAARKKAHAEERARKKREAKKKRRGEERSDESAPSEKKTKKETEKTKPEDDTVDMEDFRRARNKLKTKKRIKRLVIVAVIAAVGAGVYFTRGLWVPKLEGILEEPKETIVNDGTEQAGNFPIDTGDSSIRQISTLDGSLVTVDVSHINIYDTNGKQRDTLYHSFGSPVICSAGKKMLCYDFGGTGFKLYGKSGLIYEKQIEGTVLIGRLAENGNVLIVWEDSKYNVTVNVFDKNGADLYRWTKGDRITDIRFTGGGTGFAAATFGASEGKVVSVVHKVDLAVSGGGKASEKIEGLVMQLEETDEGNLWVMCEHELRMLNTDCSLLGSFEFRTDPVSFDLCGSCACAAADSIGGGTDVWIFGAEDVTVKAKTVHSEQGSITRVRCFDGMAFVLSSGKLDAYLPDGSLKSTAEVTDDHSDFVYSEKAAYFIDRQEVSKLIFKV